MRFRQSLVPISVLASLLACGGGGGGSSSTSTASPTPTGAISTVIYQSYASGNFDIYAIKADGTGRKALATTSDDEVARVISGDRLVYTRTTAGQKDLLSVKLDGTGTKVLSASAVDDLFVGMAGSRVVYLQKNPLTYDLRSVNLDGTDDMLLARSVYADDYANYILLDGDQVVFTSLLSGNGDLYAVHADGTGLTQLSSGATKEWVSGYAPASLDAASGAIVYDRDEGSGNDSVHAIKLDGTGHVQLTSALPSAGPAVISGGRVVYWIQNASGGYSVYSVRLDGTGTVALAADPTLDQRGNSLVGNRLIYEVDLSSSDQRIFTVNLDGTGAAQLSPSGQFFFNAGVIGSQILLQQGSYVAPTTRLFITNADGSAFTPLTPLTPTGTFAASQGSWNGRLYYVLQQAGQLDLFSCALDGSDAVTLASRTDLNEQTPRQAGNRLIYDQYLSSSGGYAGIVSIKPDGTGAITLATGPCVTAFVK